MWDTSVCLLREMCVFIADSNMELTLNREILHPSSHLKYGSIWFSSFGELVCYVSALWAPSLMGALNWVLGSTSRASLFTRRSWKIYALI